LCRALSLPVTQTILGAHSQAHVLFLEEPRTFVWPIRTTANVQEIANLRSLAANAKHENMLNFQIIPSSETSQLDQLRGQVDPCPFGIHVYNAPRDLPLSALVSKLPSLRSFVSHKIAPHHEFKNNLVNYTLYFSSLDDWRAALHASAALDPVCLSFVFNKYPRMTAVVVGGHAALRLGYINSANIATPLSSYLRLIWALLLGWRPSLGAPHFPTLQPCSLYELVKLLGAENQASKWVMPYILLEKTQRLNEVRGRTSLRVSYLEPHPESVPAGLHVLSKQHVMDTLSESLPLSSFMSNAPSSSFSQIAPEF
jgi:hypothetical protein